jgi:PhnB protein
MHKAQSSSYIPNGYHAVTPFVIVKGAAEFIDFMKQAFGAEEIARVNGEDGSIGHAEVRIGDAVVMLFDSKKEWPKTPAFLRLYVADVDDVCQRALKAGGTLITKLTDLPWGDRACRVRDPQGNLWWIMTRKEHLTPEEEGQRYGEQKYIDAMNYFQSTDFFKAS